MGRAPCCDKANVKKGPWAPEEDAKLKDYMEKHGTGGNWIALPQKAGLKRCGKSCRLRWLNYLRPNIKHGDFTEEEDKIICSLFANIGSRWSVIASQLPGRTDNDIKNYWNTKLKKKLMAMAPPHQPQRKPPPLFQSSHQTSPLLSSSPSLSSLLKDFIGGSNYHHYFNNPSKSFTGFDPIPPIPSNILLGNSSSTTLATNSTTLLEDLVSPPMQCYQPVKDGSFLTFGSEANCTLSSDVGYIQSYISSGYEENQKFMISYGNNNNGGENLSQWTTEKPNGGYYCGGETPLDYRLEDEDVNKQLISSSNNSGSSIIKGCSSNNNNNNFLIDENKTQEKVMMYSYY